MHLQGLIYDNLTSAVKKVLRGKSRIEQESFRKFRSYYSFEALNEMILKRCYTYGNHTISGRQGTVNELYEEEKKHLLDLPEVPFSNVEVCNCRVDKYSTVTLDKNRYSVPTRYSGFRLKPEHYLDLIRKRPMSFESARPIREWRKSWPKVFDELLERFRNQHGETKGIKEFISVLMFHKDYSSGEIETAVELALESNISTSEGVRHILVFMKEPKQEILPLTGWLRLPLPDVSVYGQLGGVL